MGDSSLESQVELTDTKLKADNSSYKKTFQEVQFW